MAKMVKIDQYVVSTRTFEEVLVPSSALSRKLESIGHSDGIISVNSVVASASDDHTAEELQCLVARNLNRGDKEYTPFCASASGIRKCQSLWLDKSIESEIGRWALCGLKTSDINVAINKYMAYIGLLTSATKPFADVFGFDISIDDVCVIDDIYSTVSKRLYDVVAETVEKNVELESSLNAGDGIAIVNVDAFSADEQKKLDEIGPFTGRGPWLKFLGVPTKMNQFAKENHVKTVIKDFYGNDVDISTKKIVLTKSAFKMADQYENFAQYQSAFKELGHELAVCLVDHSCKVLDLPYQALQTLPADDEDIEGMWSDNSNKLLRYKKPEEAAKLLPGYLKDAAALHRGILHDPFCDEELQKAWTSKRNSVIGGRVPGISHAPFCSPDIVAIMQGIFGLPVRGVLKSGEVSCSIFEKGDIDITRSPHLDHAHAVRYNKPAWSKYFDRRIIYLSVDDDIWEKLKADSDGDHLNCTQYQRVIDLAVKGYEVYKNNTLHYADGKAKKGPITRAAIARFVASMTEPAPVGLYADALTKMWAHGYNEEACAKLTRGANTCIDAAKHGGADTEKPYEEYKDVKLPAFCEYAKADSKHPVGSAYWTEKIETTEGTGDKWMRVVLANTPVVLTVEGLEDEVFDPSILRSKKEVRVIPGLFKKGYTMVDKTSPLYEEPGIFQKCAFRRAQDWAKVKEDALMSEAFAEYDADSVALARQEMFAYAIANGFDEEDAVNYLVKATYSLTKNPAYASAMKRSLWVFFGKEIVENISNNVADIEGEIPEV